MVIEFTAPASEAVDGQRKEVKTMNYEKPEISVLGDASRVILGTVKNDASTDGQLPSIDPAYKLDE
jgi:hypothetical protein